MLLMDVSVKNVCVETRGDEDVYDTISRPRGLLQQMLTILCNMKMQYSIMERSHRINVSMKCNKARAWKYKRYFWQAVYSPSLFALICKLFGLVSVGLMIESAYFFHVVPVCDDAMLDRVLEGQDSPFALRLIANVTVFLAHSYHHSLRKK